MFCKNIQDMSRIAALSGLRALFAERIAKFSPDVSSFIKSKAAEWIRYQALIITGLIRRLLSGKGSKYFYKKKSVKKLAEK